jgi:hypothetical protein
VPKEFLVYSPSCKIPSLDIFSPDVLEIFEKDEYEKCSDIQPLTSIDQDFANDVVKLIYHSEYEKDYLNGTETKIKCYFRQVTRMPENDRKIEKLERQYFNSTFELSKEIDFILVTCKGENKTKVYSNAHAVVHRKPEAQKILDEGKSKNSSEKPLSVLMFGIDSISRLNFIRTMPETFKHVENTGWFGLQGYNKVSCSNCLGRAHR